jgi:hypothetical protein
VFVLVVVVLEGPHNPPPIAGCLLWFWFMAPQMPAFDFSFSKSFIDLAGVVFVLGLLVAAVPPRERFHKSSKFADVAGLAGVGVVDLAGPDPKLPCRNGGVLIL